MKREAGWFAVLRRGCARVCLLALAILTGCKDLTQNRATGGNNDPLFGLAPAPPSPRSLPPSPEAKNSTPPPAAAAALTSNAALAGAGANPPPMDPAHDLRISDPPRSPDSRYPQSSGGWSGGASLQRPEPAPQNVPAGNVSPPVSVIPSPSHFNPYVNTSSGAAATYEQARAQLEARGVTWSQLEYSRDQDQYSFSCSIPNPQNPAVNRRYSGTARTDIDAMRAVLAKIDADK